MILLDTNVLVYALGGPHALQRPSEALLERLREGELPGGTIGAVYLEFLYVFSRRRTRDAAAAAARDYLELLGPPLQIADDDRALAIDLYERHARLESVDALLAAVALRGQVAALVTADRSFADVPGLRALDPRSPELEAMLG